MDITTSDLCDKILKIALQGAYLMQGRSFSFTKVCEATGASKDQAEAALLWLWKNSYMEKTDNTYVLTPHGEIFAKADGCAGQRKRQAEEESAKQEQRELVKKQEKLTQAIRCSTIWTAVATVVMAIATVGIAVFTYLQLVRNH